MTDVVMPQMGESIVEGTLTRWLKKAGEHVERDEPLFEISTDKVDTEIPSPEAGTLAEILVQEGATVAINTVVGKIGEGGAGTRRARREPSRQHHHRLRLPPRRSRRNPPHSLHRRHPRPQPQVRTRGRTLSRNARASAATG